MTPKQQPEVEFDAEALSRLADWLRASGIPGTGSPRLEKFPGGQSNPTYRLKWGAREMVLRRQPFGHLLPKAHMIDREYRLLVALKHTPVPVPQVYGLCEDATVLGVKFYLMEHVRGRIFWDPRLPGMSPVERAALFDSVNETVAHLHSVRPADIGLGTFGRPTGFMARQITLWNAQYGAAATREIPAMDALAEWLAANVPAGSADGAIFHGDLRLDNMIFHPTEPRVVALLDWELAALGDPVADFAYHLMTWRIPPDLFRGLGGLELNALGIPTEAQYIAAYCRRTGRQGLPDLKFYLAFSFFRLAAILQGIAKRALDGNANAPDAVTLGARAAPLAAIGWDLVRSP